MNVDEDGNGVLCDGHMYQLAREHDAVRQRTLEITFHEPGAEATRSRSGSQEIATYLSHLHVPANIAPAQTISPSPLG